MRLIGYCRVSTENQKEEGTVEIQRRALKEYALTKGHILSEVFSDEGISGSLEDRPGLSELFSALEADESIKGVLVYRLDRLARSLLIQEAALARLKRLGKVLLSVQEPDLDEADPTRKFCRQILGAVSELERALINSRMSGGRLSKARKGGYAGGGVALGYQAKDGDLRVDEEGAAVVREIFRLRDEGYGLREIARLLNNRGVPTARGGRWHAGTVRYILSNGLYAGEYAYKGETAARADLAIIGG